MTRHEYHIALVLLALITAGVLGYQALNPKSHGANGDCTLALYFSGPHGCDNSPAVESISAPVFTEKIEDYFTPRTESDLYDFSKNTIDSARDKRPVDHTKERPASGSSGFGSRFNTTIDEPLLDQSHPSFLLTDSHKQFLESVFGNP